LPSPPAVVLSSRGARHNPRSMSTLEIRVDNRIRVPADGLPGKALKRLRESCTHENPDFKKRKARGYATYNVPAEIRTYRLEEGGEEHSFPRGAMGRVRSVLRELGIPYRVKDARTEGAPLLHPLEYRAKDRPPRSYQREAAMKALEVEQGVVRAATGSGKTTTAIYAATLFGLNTLVVLPNVKLLKQTKEVAEKLLGTEIGIIRGKTKKLRPFTVATQQTLWSRKTIEEDVRGYFGAVIFDEAHHAAARTFQHVIDQFSCRYRIAFTADERRKDRKEFLVYDAFGQPIHEMTREQCEALGVVVDVEIRIVFSDFRADWYRKDPDFNAFLELATADEKRNDLILETALAEIRSGEQVIVCSHRREHARVLDAALIAHCVQSGVMLGGEEAGDAREFESTREGLLDGTVSVGVGTYGALGEGIDLPAVSVGVAATPIFNNEQMLNQYRGRLCRTADGKTKGRLYAIFDRKVFDQRMLSNLLRWNRNVLVRTRKGKWIDARSRPARAIMKV